MTTAAIATPSRPRRQAADSQPDTDRPARLTVDAAGAGLMVGVSDGTWRRQASAGMTPASIRFGGSVRWRVAEITSWIEAGCPSRKEWERLSAVAKKQ